jgi:hypothetical protein
MYSIVVQLIVYNVYGTYGTKHVRKGYQSIVDVVYNSLALKLVRIEYSVNDNDYGCLREYSLCIKLWCK